MLGSLCVQDTLYRLRREDLRIMHTTTHIICIQKINRWNDEENLFIAAPHSWNTNLKRCIAAEHYKKKIEMGKNKVRDMNGEHTGCKSESV